MGIKEYLNKFFKERHPSFSDTSIECLVQDILRTDKYLLDLISGFALIKCVETMEEINDISMSGWTEDKVIPKDLLNLNQK